MAQQALGSGQPDKSSTAEDMATEHRAKSEGAPTAAKAASRFSAGSASVARPGTLPAPDWTVRDGRARRRQRILIVNPAGLAERGGMGRSLRYLVENWGRFSGAPTLTILDSRGSGSVVWCVFYLTWTLMAIAYYRLRGEAVLLHVNMAENTSVLRKGVVVFWGRLLGIPTLLHLHAGRFIEFYDRLPSFAQAFARLVFRTATHTVVLGHLWRDFLIDRLRIAESQVSVVYNGVPAAPRRSFSPREGPCRLIYVGRLKLEKGLAELLRALASPELITLDWRLTLVGTGENKTFATLARSLGIADRVTQTGWLEPAAVGARLAEADVFVMPSRFEGLPLGVLEALSAGLAVLTTEVGALPEVLTNGETALMVPPNDQQALTAALRQLIGDSGLRARLGANAAALYQFRFTVATYAETISALYRRIQRGYAQRSHG